MHRSRVQRALRENGLLALLEPSDVALLDRAGVVRRFEAGEVLWRAGTPSRGLYVVLTGEVRVVRGRSGRQHLVHVSRPGATMGEVPIFQGRGYPATAITAGETSCLVVPCPTVHALVARNAAVAGWIAGRLADRVHALVDRLDGQTVGSVRGRLARSILDLGGDVALVPSPRTAWAENLGTVREVLGRELLALEEARLIARTGPRGVKVLDRAGLEAVAEPSVRSTPTLSPR